MKRLLCVCLSLALLAGICLPIPAGASDDAEILAQIEAGGLPAGISPDDPMWFKETHREEWMALANGEGDPEGVTAPVLASGSTGFSGVKTRTLLPGETLRKGIDVSVWQGDIDWKAVARSGVEFAIIRGASRGWGGAGRLMKDSSFAENVQGAKAAFETAAAKVSVTMNGEPVKGAKCLIENGNLKVRLARGITVIIR